MAHSRSRIGGVAIAACLAISTPASAGIIYSNDFSTDPFISPATWFGAQHGVQSNQASWSGAGTQFIGYTPVQRARINFFTNVINVPVGNVSLISVDTRPATFNQGGPDRLIILVDGIWYISDYVAPTNTTGTWVTETFDLTGTFKLAVLDCGSGSVCTPNTTTGPSISLPAGAVTAIGVQANWSGENSPSRGYVLRYDNFVVEGTPVPEPASLAVLGVAVATIGLVRRRKAR
ncbi:MAG: PEP-CTERM sorting domain-containing protein [Acetobacteraceae bacterium]